jgi:hypothetical protein
MGTVFKMQKYKNKKGCPKQKEQPSLMKKTP